MEYAVQIGIVIVVAFVSWCVGVRMGANFTAKRIVEEMQKN